MIRYYDHTDLTRRNSFGIRATAHRLAEFTAEEELREIFAELRRSGSSWRALGGGNNIIFRDDFPGTLIRCAARGIELLSQDGTCARVRADAGVEWDDLVDWCCQRGLWGVENLSLIPGTVGAAPVQNIGAYGAEAGEVIESVRFLSADTGEAAVLRGEECRFGYRDSIFKHELAGAGFITSVVFRLGLAPRPRLRYGAMQQEVERLGEATLHNIRRAVVSIRRAKLPDPAVTGNAGSFFKNPVVPLSAAERIAERYPDMPRYAAPEPGTVKLAAGWLIDRAGLRGASFGRVGVHSRQALVLVNLGGATGRDVLECAEQVRTRVRETFGVDIEPEVNIF